MNKKFISIFLLLATTAMTLASCGDTSNTSGTGTTNLTSSVEKAKLNITLDGDDGVDLSIVERDNSTGYVVVGIDLGKNKTISNINVFDSENKAVDYHKISGNTRLVFSLTDKDVTVDVDTADTADVQDTAIYQGILDWTEDEQTMSFTNTLSGDFSVEHTVKYYFDDEYSTFRVENSSYNEHLYDYYNNNGYISEKFLGLDNKLTYKDVISTLNNKMEYSGSIYTTNLLKYLICNGEDDDGNFTFASTKTAALSLLKSRLASSATTNDEGDIVFNYYPDSSSDYAFFTPYFLMNTFNAFYGSYISSYNFKVQITISSYTYAVKSFIIELDNFTITTESSTGVSSGRIVFNDPSLEKLEPDEVVPLTGDEPTEHDTAFNKLVSVSSKLNEGNYTLDVTTENVGSDGLPAGYSTNFDDKHKYKAHIVSYLSDDEDTKNGEGYAAGTTTANFMQVSDSPLKYDVDITSSTTTEMKSNVTAIYGANDGSGKIKNASIIGTELEDGKLTSKLLSVRTSTSSSSSTGTSTTTTPFYVDSSALYGKFTSNSLSKLMISSSDSTSGKTSLTLDLSDKGVTSEELSQQIFSYFDSPLEFAFGQVADARFSDPYKVLSYYGVIESVTFTIPDDNSLTVYVEMGTTLTYNASTAKCNTTTTFTFTNIGKTKLSTITDAYSADLELIKSTYAKQA